MRFPELEVKLRAVVLRHLVLLVLAAMAFCAGAPAPADTFSSSPTVAMDEPPKCESPCDDPLSGADERDPFQIDVDGPCGVPPAFSLSLLQVGPAAALPLPSPNEALGTEPTSVRQARGPPLRTT